MKIIIVVLSLVVFAFSANAEMRIYNPESGANMSVDDLVKQGVVENISSKDLKGKTKNEKRTLFRSNLDSIINEKADGDKTLLERSDSMLGVVAVFIESKNVDEGLIDVINKIYALSDVTKFFFLKQPSSIKAISALSMRMGDSEIKPGLKLDISGKRARELRVQSYPVVVYISSDGSRYKFGLNHGGYTALIRLKEHYRAILIDGKK